jgi:hypothetical protein
MTDAKRGELPPEPEFPRRVVTPPSRESGTFELDAKTPAKGHAVLQYQALISVFDALTPAARLDFVELCEDWGDLDAGARRRAIDLVKRELGRL